MVYLDISFLESYWAKVGQPICRRLVSSSSTGVSVTQVTHLIICSPTYFCPGMRQSSLIFYLAEL